MAFSKGVVLAGLLAGGVDVQAAASNEHPCGGDVQQEMNHLFSEKDMNIKQISAKVSQVEASIKGKLNMFERTIAQEEEEAKKKAAELAALPGKAPGVDQSTIEVQVKDACSSLYGGDCHASKCGADPEDYPSDFDAFDIDPSEKMGELLQSFDVAGHSVDETLVEQTCRSALKVPDGEDEFAEYELCKGFCNAFATGLKEKAKFTGADKAVTKASLEISESSVQSTKDAYKRCAMFQVEDLYRMSATVQDAVETLDQLEKSKHLVSEDVDKAFGILDDLFYAMQASNEAQQQAQQEFDEKDSKHKGVSGQLASVRAKMQGVAEELQKNVDLLQNIGLTTDTIKNANIASEEIKMKLVLEIQAVIDATNRAVRDPIVSLLQNLPNEDAFVRVEKLEEHKHLEQTATELVSSCHRGGAFGEDLMMANNIVSGENGSDVPSLCPWKGNKEAMTADLKEMVVDIEQLQRGHFGPKFLLSELQTKLMSLRLQADDWYEGGAHAGDTVQVADGFSYEGACEDDLTFFDAEGRSCEEIVDNDVCKAGGYDPTAHANANGRHAGQACCSCGGGVQLTQAGELGLLRKLFAKFGDLPVYKEYFDFWAVQGSHKKYFSLMLEQLNLAKISLGKKTVQLEEHKKALEDTLAGLKAEIEGLEREVEAATKAKGLSQKQLDSAAAALAKANKALADAQAAYDALTEVEAKITRELEETETRLTGELNEMRHSRSLLERRARSFVERNAVTKK